MRIKNLFVSVGLVSGLVASQSLWAVPAQVPIFLTSGAESLNMLNLSNDHQLFYKAYDDWSDIDGDGDVDTTYKHDIDYYGYFDSYKCYAYDTSDDRFEPASITMDKTCSGQWSGNFMNWATMSRIDTVRKILYGGKRSTDTSSVTVLERAYLPTDAHSFAKYFNDALSSVSMEDVTPFGSSVSEITICNTTHEGSGLSQDANGPPLMRVAEGNFALWAANERWQCHWGGTTERGAGASNDNDPAKTLLLAASSNPVKSTDGLGEDDYQVKIQACVTNLIGKENCKLYGTSRKPIGLLQEYGDSGDTHFGLMTGSYRKNKSGGTLRKNIGTIADEINLSDGTFKTPPSTGSIIGTLNALRVSNYSHSDGTYKSLGGFSNCTFNLGGFVDGQCSNWGNPQSEIFLETLRYFAGESPNFAADDSAYLCGTGSECANDVRSDVASDVDVSWSDPLSTNNYCAPIKVIQFNASVTSFDGDNLGGTSDLYDFGGSVDTWTNKVGAGEGVSGGSYFVGNATATTGQDGLCTAKALSNLADASGLCPEAPRLGGSYDIAGLAHYAKTRSIRNDLDDESGADAVINVETFGVTLSPAVPKIDVPVPGSNNVVTILPACRNDSQPSYADNPSGGGNCAIVDFKVIEKHTETSAGSGVFTGRFYVNWEDSEQGGDYDQDMYGVIEYEITSSNITVTTDVFAQSTPFRLGFGYVISGTTQDGFHVHSGINGFAGFTDPTGVPYCGDGTVGSCTTGASQTTVTYNLGSGSGTLLRDPLYYAAKWGGFEEEEDDSKRPPLTADPNGKPDQDYEWKSSTTGLPKNYFFSRNPGQLSSQLATVFQTIATVSSSASVVANSVSLETSTRIYQARFDGADWSGKLLSFPVTIATGALEIAEWDAGAVIAGQDYDSGRVFVTWNPVAATGVAFRWNDNNTPGDLTDDIFPDTGLTTAQRTALNLDPVSGTDDGLGSERLDFLRGDTSNELANGGTFRNRSTPLGDVVHSTPTVVAAPNFNYSDATYGYFKFQYGDSECFLPGGVTRITNWTAGSGGVSGTAGGREPMVYFGGNDGALHGVSACTGAERLAFVPNTVYLNLSRLTSLDYSHQYYVDGPSTVVDAYFTSDTAWHSVLVGTLRGGGKSVFALDVTDPDDFTESNAGSIVLWEIDPTTDIDATPAGPDYPELGFTFSQPAVINAEGHGWVAVFGNGYHGASGKAVLYLADIEDGSLVASIDLSSVDATAHGAGNCGTLPCPNGLSTVSPIDIDGDGDVDLIYAGDLNGNIWRFAATPGSGFAAATTTLLYSARTVTDDAQPITSRMAVGRHPTSAVGRIVYFGTGKYYEAADQNPANAVQYNTIYGIWDRDIGTNYYTVSASNKVASVTTRDSNLLQQQTIDTQTVGTEFFQRDDDGNILLDLNGDPIKQTFDIRVVSNTPMAWVTPSGTCGPYVAGTSGSCGWYLDLTDTGEKMVATPILRGGRLIFVTTIPSLVACAAGGSGWLMEIDPNTGGRIDLPLFDLNGDGVFDYQDNLATTSGGNTVYTPISGKKSKVGILQPPAILAGVGGSGDGSYGGAEGKYSSGTQDAQIDVTIENPGILAAGRKSWARIK